MALSHTLLAKIHVAKKQLALDDNAYRAMLRGVAGVESSKELTPALASKLLRHMQKCGFAPTRPLERCPHVAVSREQQIRKIEALLADAGRPWAYVVAMVPRICKVDAIGFCDGEMLGKLIAALQYDANRRKRA